MGLASNDSSRHGVPAPILGGPTPAPARGAAPARTPSSGRSLARAATRRQYDRHEIDRRVIVTELDALGVPQTSWECRAVDLSRCGVGLRSKRMVYQGRKLFVEFLPEQGVAGKLLYGVVKQSRYAEGEGYAVGLEFEKPPNTLAVREWRARRGR